MSCVSSFLRLTFATRARLHSQVVSKAQSVAVTVLNVEVAIAVGLIADVSRDLDALRRKLGIKRVRIIDPDIRIPRFALRIGDAVGPHEPRLGKLAEHNDDPAAGTPCKSTA